MYSHIIMQLGLLQYDNLDVTLKEVKGFIYNVLEMQKDLTHQMIPDKIIEKYVPIKRRFTWREL